MIIDSKQVESAAIYRVECRMLIYGGQESKVSEALHYVVAFGFDQAMEIVKAFYDSEHFGDVEFKSVIEMGNALYVLDLLSAKGVPLRGEK